MSGKIEHIFLFGHRKQHGKDTCCDILESILSHRNRGYCRTSFAKRLKEMAAKEYNLDVNRMDDDEYKSSYPSHLDKKSVREMLIHIGCRERKKDPAFWAKHATSDIIKSGHKIGMVSDFRFPNEAMGLENCGKIHKILVHRPNGKFVSDGADDQLPDVDSYWDHVIMNDDDSNTWKSTLVSKVKEVLNNYV